MLLGLVLAALGHMLKASLAILFSLTVIHLTRTEVLACSPNPCPERIRGPRTMTTVPANALAIRLLDVTTVVTLMGPAGAVSLKRETTAAGETLLRPNVAELPRGMYTLSHERKCTFSGIGGPITTQFEIVEPSSPPTTFGEFFTFAAGVRYPRSIDVEAGALQTDAAVYAYQSLIDLDVQLDGQPFSMAPFSGQSSITLSAFCPPDGSPGSTVKDSCGRISQVTAGTHQLSIAATIVGVGKLPPVVGQVRLDCAWLSSIDAGPKPFGTGGAGGGSGMVDPGSGGVTGSGGSGNSGGSVIGSGGAPRTGSGGAGASTPGSGGSGAGAGTGGAPPAGTGGKPPFVEAGMDERATRAGGGCRIAGAPPVTNPAQLLGAALLGLWLFARRRR